MFRLEYTYCLWQLKRKDQTSSDRFKIVHSTLKYPLLLPLTLVTGEIECLCIIFLIRTLSTHILSFIGWRACFLFEGVDAEEVNLVVGVHFISCNDFFYNCLCYVFFLLMVLFWLPCLNFNKNCFVHYFNTETRVLHPYKKKKTFVYRL
jgi:hypothetical protein